MDNYNENEPKEHISRAAHSGRRSPKNSLKNKRSKYARIGIFGTAVVTAVMTIMAFCFWLRPTFSQIELRDLTTFPSFTFESFLNGDYFSDIELWFADTFPNRESMMTLANDLENMYGFRSTQVYGNVEKGDEIPTVSDDDTTMETTEPTTDEPTTSETTTEEGPTAAPTEEPTTEETTTEEEPEVPALDDDAKVETIDALLVIDDAAYEYYNFSADVAKEYVAAMNDAADKLDGIANVYDMIVPNSMGVCVPSDVSEEVGTSDQREAIKYIYSCFDDNVNSVYIYDDLVTAYSNGEYVYFRTDHHWTATGAYHAYKIFAAQAGKYVASLDKDFIEHVYTGFLGTFYSTIQSSAMENNPDTVYAYEPKDTNVISITWPDKTTSDYRIITNVQEWARNSRYSSCFIGGDEPYSVIENPNITDGSAICVVKESYGNCFVPFLVESYEYVYVVDYRYYNDVRDGGLVDLVKEYNIQDVLFINNITITRSEYKTGLIQDFIDG